jgi:hypothetical protein
MQPCRKLTFPVAVVLVLITARGIRFDGAERLHGNAGKEFGKIPGLHSFSRTGASQEPQFPRTVAKYEYVAP